jgi:hypothetical protein
MTIYISSIKWESAQQGWNCSVSYTNHHRVIGAYTTKEQAKEEAEKYVRRWNRTHTGDKKYQKIHNHFTSVLETELTTED